MSPGWARAASSHRICTGIGRRKLGKLIEGNEIAMLTTRLGDGRLISRPLRMQELDGDGYYIRDGIVIVPKDGVLPDDTVV